MVKKRKKQERRVVRPRGVIWGGLSVRRCLALVFIIVLLFSIVYLSLTGIPPTQQAAIKTQAEGEPPSDEPVEYKDYGTYGPVVGGIECGGKHCSAKIHYRPPGKIVGEYVELFYADDSDSRVYEGPVRSRVHGEYDYVAVFKLDGLKPQTTYYYRVTDSDSVLVGGNKSCLPSFRTFPMASEDVNFRFVVFADLIGSSIRNGELIQRDHMGAPGYKSAVTQDFGFQADGVNDLPAFFLQIGDFDHRDPAKAGLEMDNWRRMHRDVMYNLPSGQDFNSHIACKMPVFHIWDDHDYGANNAGGDAEFKDIATRAFLEYYPMPDLPNDPRTSDEGGLWHSFRYGQAEFFILDARSHREYRAQTLNNRWIKWLRSRGRRGDWSNLKSMLGNRQLYWLRSGLLESDAKWKFIVSSSMWNQLGTKPFESWNAYPTEREVVREIIEYAREQHLEDNPGSKERIIFISGDIHSGGAIDLGLNNPNGYVELSVPHSNLCLARPTSGYGKGAQAGSWYFFNPGSQDVIGDFEGGPVKGTVFNSGYAIVEVYHIPDQGGSDDSLRDWVTIKLVNSRIRRYDYGPSDRLGWDVSDARVVYETSIILE